MNCKVYTQLALTGALVAGIGAAYPIYAGQTRTTTAVVVDDSTLNDRVEEAIEKDPTLKNQAIDVDVKDHVVTLTGAVQTDSRKVRAEHVAKIAGVTRVDNQLRVDAKDGKSMSAKTGDATKKAAKKTGEVAATAGEKTKDVAVATGEKTKDVAKATGENITDGYITTALHAKFVDEKTLSGSDISVDTNNHVVTLKGTVVSAAGKARAEEIARTTKGVNRVVNQLVIGPKK
jgi:hyperosmotically inducible protein